MSAASCDVSPKKQNTERDKSCQQNTTVKGFEWCRCTVCLKASCRIVVIKATLLKCTYWKHQFRDGTEQQHSCTLIRVCWIYKDAAECTAGVFKPRSFDWQVSCWRPRAAAAVQPWIEIRKWVISARVAEGYSKGNPSPRSSPTTTLSPLPPILATANIHTPIPPVDLHLRNDHTPSLPPQANNYTTHPTW